MLHLTSTSMTILAAFESRIAAQPTLAAAAVLSSLATMTFCNLMMMSSEADKSRYENVTNGRLMRNAEKREIKASSTFLNMKSK